MSPPRAWTSFSPPWSLMAFSVAARYRASLVSVTFSSWAADRKSTRLNSSHVAISYAFFCAKKKIMFGGVGCTAGGAVGARLLDVIKKDVVVASSSLRDFQDAARSFNTIIDE